MYEVRLDMYCTATPAVAAVSETTNINADKSRMEWYRCVPQWGQGDAFPAGSTVWPKYHLASHELL